MAQVLIRTAVLGLWLLSIFASTVECQTSGSAPPIVRDTQAIATIQNAINAMGGASAIAAIQDSTVQGTEQDIANPDASTPASFIWQTLGSEFHCTTQNANGTYSELSGHGKPAEFKHGQWSPVSSLAAMAYQPFYLPGLVLYNELQNPNNSLQWIGSATINGNAAIQVHIGNDSGALIQLVTSQDWYFDPSSFLPIRVEYNLPIDWDTQKPIPVSMNFASFKPISGVIVPFLVNIQVSRASTSIALSVVNFNSGLPSSTFDPPSGAAQ